MRKMNLTEVRPVGKGMRQVGQHLQGPLRPTSYGPTAQKIKPKQSEIVHF